MRKYFSLFIALSIATITQAQQIPSNDAFNYTDKDLNGTARFKGMSGAFGAVGGDLSAINVNPAGNAIFNYNSASFSLGYFNKNNKSIYLNHNTSDKYNGLDIGQIGSSLVFKSRNPENTMKKFVIGFNFENTKNFNNNTYISGINKNQSISNYFLNAANHGNNGGAFPEDELSIFTDKNENMGSVYSYLGNAYGILAQQAFLGYQGRLTNPNENSDGYNSNMGVGPYYQQKQITQSGFNGKLTGNFAAQLGDRFYIGGNLNAHFTEKTHFSEITEATKQATDGQAEALVFDNELYTYGNGFSLNIGVISQVTEGLRLGIAYESPTWYRLTDNLTQSLYTRIKNTEKIEDYYVNPYVTTIYNKYTIQTPASYTGSFAYIFGQSGLVSIDYTLKDYSTTKMKPTGNFEDANYMFKNDLTTSSELRIGAEYKIKNISLRGGYRYEQSPYKNYKEIGDLNSFSTGIGFEFSTSRLDLAYSHTSRPYEADFSLSDTPNFYRIKGKENIISLTYNIIF